MVRANRFTEAARARRFGADSAEIAVIGNWHYPSCEPGIVADRRRAE